MNVMIALFILLSIHLTSESTVISCNLGDVVSFKCPCSRLERCTLTRKSDGSYLVRGGHVNNNKRYSFNKSSQEFRLIAYQEEDEGTYVWNCEKKHHHVHLYERKQCFHGSQVSFKCPCCQREFESCNFKIPGEGGYIFRRGAFEVHHHRFNMDEQKTRIILENCIENDEGTYVWICKTCNINRTFALEVLKYHHHHADQKSAYKICSGNQREAGSLVYTPLVLDTPYKLTNIISSSSKTLITFPWPYLCLQFLVIACLKKGVFI